MEYADRSRWDTKYLMNVMSFKIRIRFPHITREIAKNVFIFPFYWISEPRELHGKLCYKSFWLLYYIHNISTRHKATDLLDILYAIAKLWESFFVRRYAALRVIYICTICFQFFLFFYNIFLVSLDDKHLCIFWNIYEREREKEREKLVSFEHKTYTWLCEGGCVSECLFVCVYVVGPRRKWTQGMVKRLTQKLY